MAPIAVGIVNHNTRELLRNCVLSVISQHPAEIVVVDNASTDGSAAMVAEQFPDVRLFSSQANAGYGAAANQAVAGCSAEYILLLNSDTTLVRGSLDALCRELDEQPRVAITGPRLLNLDGSIQISCFPFPTPLDVFLDSSNLIRLARYLPWTRERALRTWSHSTRRQVPWVSGAALAIRRAAFDEVGGFDPLFFMYYEEVDLCYRLRKAGWQVTFSPAAEVVHLGGASSRQYHGPMLVQFYDSLKLFYRRHYSAVRNIELASLVWAIAIGRLARDRMKLRLARAAGARQVLQGNIFAWQQLMRAAKERQGSHSRSDSSLE